MQHSDIQAINAINAPIRQPARTALWRRMLDFLAKRDRHYREVQNLRALSKEHLHDMGISRTQAEVGFYRKYGQRPADTAPIYLGR